MPRPPAAEQPKQEIDSLLAELVARVSAEFDRLLQENFTLTQRLKVREFAAPGDPAPLHGTSLFAKGLELKDLPAQQSSWRNHRSNNNNNHSSHNNHNTNTNSNSHSNSTDVDNVQAQAQAQAASVSVSVSASASAALPLRAGIGAGAAGSEGPLSKASSTSNLNPSVSVNVAPNPNPNPNPNPSPHAIISTSTSNLNSSAGERNWSSAALLELFHRLDLEGRGELTFESLVSLLRRHKQPCEYMDLVNLVRRCHCMEPLDLTVSDPDLEAENLAEAARSECLTLDFPAFVSVMGLDADRAMGTGPGIGTGVGTGTVLAGADTGADTRADTEADTGTGTGRGGSGRGGLDPAANADARSQACLACLQSLRTACQKEAQVPAQAQGQAQVHWQGQGQGQWQGQGRQWSASGFSSGQSHSQVLAQAQALGEGQAQGQIQPKVSMSKSRSEDHYHISPTVFWLEMVPTCVILLNMVVTGLSIDYPEREVVWDICEGFFVSFYVVESVAKMRFFGCHGYFFGRERWWNWFDFLCLQISFVDTVIKICLALFWKDQSTSALRGLLLTKVFRLARLARLVRTLRFKIFYELKLMVMGVFSGLRVLSWAVVLLIFLAYPMGVGMTSMLDRSVAEFDSVLDSMFTLFRCWTDGCSALDGTPLPEKLYREHGTLFMLFHILMTMFVTVGLFNLIMAIFIDNVVNTQALRKAKEMAERSQEFEQKFKKLFTNFLHNGIKERNETFWERMSRLVSEIRERDAGFRKTVMHKISNDWENLRNTNISISKEMFAQWLEQEDFKQLLEDADIETTSHAELFDVLDADMGGELSMDELTTGLMRLRGPVSKADIAAVRLKVSFLTTALESAVGSMPEHVSGGLRQKLSEKLRASA